MIFVNNGAVMSLLKLIGFFTHGLAVTSWGVDLALASPNPSLRQSTVGIFVASMLATSGSHIFHGLLEFRNGRWKLRPHWPVEFSAQRVTLNAMVSILYLVLLDHARGFESPLLARKDAKFLCICTVVVMDIILFGSTKRVPAKSASKKSK